MKKAYQKLERQGSQLSGRIMDAQTNAVIKAYEQKIHTVAEEKLRISEKIERCGKPYEETLRTTLDLLSNPINLWVSPCLEDKRAVLKLAFLGNLKHRKNEGFRTPSTSLPFKVLGDNFFGGLKR